MESSTDTQPINVLDGAGGPFTVPAAVIPATQDGQPPGILAAVPATDVRQQPQQVPQQIPSGSVSGETLVLLLAAGFCIAAWRRSKTMRLPIVAALIVGVLMAGSMFGLMVKQTAGTSGTQMENMVNGVKSGNGTGGAGTTP